MVLDALKGNPETMAEMRDNALIDSVREKAEELISSLEGGVAI